MLDSPKNQALKDNMTLLVLQNALSFERLQPYQTYMASRSSANIDARAAALYVWNSKISAAFLELAQYYEVALRNTIVKAIEIRFPRYGIQDKAFIRSIPKYSQNEILSLILDLTEKSQLSDGKIISSLNFFFWETILNHMFLQKQNNPHKPLFYKQRNVFLGGVNNDDIEKIAHITKKFRLEVRNRICHHEPIFKSNLDFIYREIMWAINKISPELHQFILDKQSINTLLSQKPI